MAAEEGQHVLLFSEAEVLIENLTTFSIKDIGCSK